MCDMGLHMVFRSWATNMARTTELACPGATYPNRPVLLQRSKGTYYAMPRATIPPRRDDPLPSFARHANKNSAQVASRLQLRVESNVQLEVMTVRAKLRFTLSRMHLDRDRLESEVRDIRAAGLSLTCFCPE